MRKSGPIVKEWNSYRSKIIPADAGIVQLRESEQAFWAGVVSCYNAILDAMASKDDEAKMRMIMQDILNFADEELRSRMA